MSSIDFTAVTWLLGAYVLFGLFVWSIVRSGDDPTED